MSQQKILIITHSRDNESIGHVTALLQAKQVEVIRLNVDRYPVDVSLTSTFRNNQWQLDLCHHGKKISLHDVTAVWFRRAYRLGEGLDTILDKEFLPAALGEVKQTLFGMIEGMECFQLSRPSTYRRLDSKEQQLKLAVACGLKIPATCISNDPEEVSDFIRSLGKPVVSKMQSSFAIYREDAEHVVFTSDVTAGHLANINSVQYCPMIFQEKLEKKLELRVTIVGKRIFAFSIDSQKQENAQTDWRKEGIALINQWQPYTLPQHIQESLLVFMERLQLQYGAIDIILTPEDDYYFLEVNAAGEFFWLDRLCDHAISTAIAEVLITGRDN